MQMIRIEPWTLTWNCKFNFLRFSCFQTNFLLINYFSPERMEEVNSSRTQKPQNKLKTSTENVPEKIKKSKQKTNENEEIKVKTKSHKEKKDKKDKTKKKEEDVDLLGTPVKEKHRKKEKKIKNDSKMGYEEAIGISTPSKEMVQI